MAAGGYDRHVKSVVDSAQNEDEVIRSSSAALTDELKQAKDAEEVETRLHLFMTSVSQIVRDLPASGPQQDRLIALLKHLKSLGALEGDKFQNWSGRVWSDMPLLGMEMRSEWNAAPGDISAAQWTNMNAFAAKLTVSDVQDYSLYGIWSFRDALETDKGDLSFHISGILPWFDIANSRLLEWCKQERNWEPEQDNQPNPSSLGSLAKKAGIEQKGYSVARWTFWKERLQEISSSRNEYAELASQCLKKAESLG